jgi:hypothetical protein
MTAAAKYNIDICGRNHWIIAIVLFSFCCADLAWGTEITWSGRQWVVRDDTGGPGPNTFAAANVRVDADGVLHLQITKSAGGWTCAEVYTTEALGYGTYEFTLGSAVDRLDPNIVLGLFNYPEANAGPNGTNEIDIEFSHWGAAENPLGNYTVWPARLGVKNAHHEFDMPAAVPTIQRFTWAVGSVKLETQRMGDGGKPTSIAAWTTPRSFEKSVGHVPMPVHLNLWLFNGKPPADGKDVEILVRQFKYAK